MAESRGRELLEGLGIPERSTSGRCRRSPAASSCACCWRRRCSASPTALLLDEPTNNLDLDTIRWLERFLPTTGRAGHHLPRPPLPQRGLHPHRGHRLRDDHRLPGRLRRHGRWPRARSALASSRRTPSARRRSSSSRTSWPASRAGTRASQVQSRKKQIEKLALTDLKKSNIERPFIQLQQEALGQADAHRRGPHQEVARRHHLRALRRPRHQGREDRHRRQERRRQDHPVPHARR
jgi:hypothetical protein